MVLQVTPKTLEGFGREGLEEGKEFGWLHGSVFTVLKVKIKVFFFYMAKEGKL